MAEEFKAILVIYGVEAKKKKKNKFQMGSGHVGIVGNKKKTGAATINGNKPTPGKAIFHTTMV